MAQSRRRRGKRGSAGIDRVGLRALVRDIDKGSPGAVVGVVRVPPGETTHYRVVDGDILVEVEIMPHGERVSARLGALAGGPTKGIWAIPDPETEVVVVFQGGEFEADPYVVGVLPSGQAPTGLVPGKIFIIGLEVLVHDGSGAAPLAKKSDVQDLRDWVQGAVVGHTHGGVVAGSGTSGTATVTYIPATAPHPAGTTILKAK